MIILLGGVSCTGKTAFAQNLLERYKIPYLSIDHLKMGLYRGTADNKYNPEMDSRILAEHLWPILKGIIMTAVENNQNLIVEGCYLLPNRIAELEQEYRSHIVLFYIGFTQKYIETNYETGIVKYSSVIEARDDDAVDPITQLITEHAEQKALCKEHNATYFEINDNYLDEMNEIYKWIDSEVNKLF